MSKKNEFGKKGWTPERLGSLKGKTFVITGASSGTGFFLFKLFIIQTVKRT